MKLSVYFCFNYKLDHETTKTRRKVTDGSLCRRRNPPSLTQLQPALRLVFDNRDSVSAAAMMTQCRKCFNNLKQLFKRGVFSSECHYSCLNDISVRLIGCFYLTSENEKLILSVLTLLHIPVVRCDRAGYLCLRLVIPAGPGGRSWDVCLTTRQTVMKDGRRSRKRRRGSSNQSLERPRRCRLVGTLPFPRQNIIKR